MWCKYQQCYEILRIGGLTDPLSVMSSWKEKFFICSISWSKKNLPWFSKYWRQPVIIHFVKTCQQYLDEFDIKLSFKEIENMYQWTFKKLVKEKTAGLKYLPTYKNRIKPQIFIIMIYRCKNILLMETARKTFLS